MKKNIQNDHSSSLEDASCPAEELSPKQVALALGVSEASLKRWCDNGLLDSTRTAGGHRRISRGSVMAFLREREQPAVRPELLG
ncbi:MAG: helix-turn-helix domain-containing protein, partial [Planctomycetota bacterium]